MKTCAERLKENLESKNLNFECGTDKDGDSIIEFPYQGKVAKMFFSGEEGQYLSIYLVFERVLEEKLADVIFVCNELNAKYKWVTFYVDKDNDVMFHIDAVLTPETAAEVAFEMLIRILKIGDDVKPIIMKAIYA